MYYIPTPASLEAIDPALPTPAEDPALLADIIRQTRSVFRSAILNEHNPDGSHKAFDAKNLADRSVTYEKIAHHATDDTQRAIGSDHIKDRSITEKKLALGAITSDMIQSLAGNKLQPSSVEGSALKDGTIEGTKLKPLSLDGKSFKTGSIPNDALEGKISGDKFDSVNLNKLSAGFGRILVGGNDNKAVEADVGGAVTASLEYGENQEFPKLVFEVSSLGQIFPLAVIHEWGLYGGRLTAYQTWKFRPAGVTGPGRDQAKYIIPAVGNDAQMCDDAPEGFKLKDPGTYLCYITSPGFKIGQFAVRLVVVDPDDSTKVNKVLITSGVVDADKDTKSQTNAVAMGAFRILPDEAPAVLRLQLYSFETGASGILISDDNFGRVPAAVAVSAPELAGAPLSTIILIKLG